MTTLTAAEFEALSITDKIEYTFRTRLGDDWLNGVVDYSTALNQVKVEVLRSMLHEIVDATGTRQDSINAAIASYDFSGTVLDGKADRGATTSTLEDVENAVGEKNGNIEALEAVLGIEDAPAMDAEAAALTHRAIYFDAAADNVLYQYESLATHRVDGETVRAVVNVAQGGSTPTEDDLGTHGSSSVTASPIFVEADPSLYYTAARSAYTQFPFVIDPAVSDDLTIMLPVDFAPDDAGESRQTLVGNGFQWFPQIRWSTARNRLELAYTDDDTRFSFGVTDADIGDDGRLPKMLLEYRRSSASGQPRHTLLVNGNIVQTSDDTSVEATLITQYAPQLVCLGRRRFAGATNKSDHIARDFKAYGFFAGQGAISTAFKDGAQKLFLDRIGIKESNFITRAEFEAFQARALASLGEI